MKIVPTSWPAAMILVVLWGLSAVAQEPKGGRGGPPGGSPPPSPLLVALDADGDGEMSASEIENAATALRTLDKNKDGKLTRDEIGPVGRGGVAPTGPSAAELVERMMAFDKDGDRKLSKEELPERMRGLLDRADANKDGVVDKDELTRHAQQQAARGAEVGRGPGEGRGERP